MKEYTKKEKIYLLIVFIITLVLCYIFPYTHDDWPWGGAEGIYRLKTFFHNYNGRLFGNLLVLALTRVRPLRAITIALTITGIIVLIKKITNSKKSGLYLAILLFLCMPINMFAQSIVWTSGFSNYVPPTLFALLYIYINKNIFKKEKKQIETKYYIPMLLFGYISSLFIEHVTIYFIIISLAATIYNSKKCKKLDIANLMFFIGILSGAVLMFSNTAYRSSSLSNDEFRSIGNGGIISSAYNTYTQEIYRYFIQNNIVILIIIGILAIIATVKYYKKIKPIKKYEDILLKLSSLIIIGFITYLVYTKLMNGTNIFILDDLRSPMEALISSVYIIALLISTFFLFNGEKKWLVLFEIVSVIIMAAPLLIVTPIGPRCFFHIYIYYIMIGIEYYSLVTKNKEREDLSLVFSIAAMLLLICTFNVYRDIHKIDLMREEYIKEHKDDDHIYLPEVRNAYYTWGVNPESYIYRFKVYYGIEDKYVEFIDYVEWRHNYYHK